MAMPRSKPTGPFRLVTLVPPEILAKIDEQVDRRGFGTTRSTIVREILQRALAAQRDEPGVRAAS